MEEEEEDSGNSSGDEFYDRTTGHASARALNAGAPSKRQRADEPAPETDDAASLYGKKVTCHLMIRAYDVS